MIGPGFSDQKFEVLCEEANIPFYLQMMHGFPYENISLVQEIATKSIHREN